MRKAMVSGVLSALFLAFGCASTPKSPNQPIPCDDTHELDIPCDFHRNNPNGKALATVLWEMCSDGEIAACVAYGDLVRQGPWEEGR